MGAKWQTLRIAVLRGIAWIALLSLFYGVAWGMRQWAERGAEAVGTDAAPARAAVTVVLDAGHGGEDGGAVGQNGVLEKDLNLRIALMLGEQLEAAGVHVVYTRRDDRLLYTAEQNIPGKRKQYDLRNRLSLARAQEGAVLVSIHMNQFSASRYSGLQVYYATADERSRALAQCMQETVRRTLQPENRRQIKAGDSSIYLLDRADFPAVLVECGFLSNSEECARLSEEEYDRELSFSLFCAIMEYLQTEE